MFFCFVCKSGLIYLIFPQWLAFICLFSPVLRLLKGSLMLGVKQRPGQGTEDTGLIAGTQRKRMQGAKQSPAATSEQSRKQQYKPLP